jgi:hypothetical protein
VREPSALGSNTAERRGKNSVRFAAKQSKSRRSAYGHFPPPGCFALICDVEDVELIPKAGVKTSLKADLARNPRQGARSTMRPG